MQRKTALGLIVFTLSLGLLFAYAPFAYATPQLDWGTQLNAAQCGKGKLVINLVQNVTNNPDSGQAGNVWAYENFTRQIQVWNITKTGDAVATYCAIVRYEGNFTGIEAQTSPGQTGTLNGDEMGDFQGGFRAIIQGSFAISAPTKGFIGTVDCEFSTDFCIGHVSDWTTLYFSQPVSSFDLVWWGWIYHGGQYGTWVNAITGNTGDIISQP
jgi:hypothetical protein